MKALARYQNILLREQRHIGVNNLPKVVARQCSSQTHDSCYEDEGLEVIVCILYYDMIRYIVPQTLASSLPLTSIPSIKPLLSTKFGERAFSYAGPHAWNQLTEDLRSVTNAATFRKHLKTHFFKLRF